MVNGDNSERLPQEGKCRDEGAYGLLESASSVAHRILEEIEALAGTTACKSVQLLRLKRWAQENGCWFDDRSLFFFLFLRDSNFGISQRYNIYLETRARSSYFLIVSIIFILATARFFLQRKAQPKKNDTVPTLYATPRKANRS